MSLARQFLIAAGAVLVGGMLLVGVWVTGEIEASVTRNAASATALYVDGVIAPLLATVEAGEPLGSGARRALEETLGEEPLAGRIASFKLWLPDGTIAYSSREELVGRTFPPTDSLIAATKGAIAAEFDDLGDDEDALERAEDRPLLEIYSPVRQPWSGRVVAVAEFYEFADDLAADLLAARLRAWAFMAAVTAAMIAVTFGVVLRGSRLIERQRGELLRQVGTLSRLLAQNEDLRRTLRDANARAAGLNERFLRRVAADIHDGPAQLLALASLRLGSPALAVAGGEEIAAVRGHLDEAMTELRAISRGLALPEIERLPLDRLIAAAVDAHRARTGTEVDVASTVEGDLPLGPSERIAVYRFLQETLANAFRHAGGAGQRVTAAVERGVFRLEVRDAGPGFDPSAPTDRLGLAGLRDRIESLGGRLEVDGRPGGARVTLTLSIGHGGEA